MKNNINKKIGATLLSAAIMAGTAVIPMSNAAVEAKVNNAPSIKYEAHVQDHGWMGFVNEGEVAGTFYEARRVEALHIKLENCPENVKLHIVAHIQDYGDTEFTVTPADADKLVGTQWEARRVEAITITTEGLNEIGYKLQYRVHGQDYGWQDWVDEGKMAGSMYQARRLEAIQMQIVPTNNVAAVKAEAIAKLNSYDVALSDYDTKKVPETTYKRLSAQLKETISKVNSANNNEEINEIMSEQVKRLERYTTPDTMEDVVEKTQAKFEKSLEDINKLIADYEEFIPNSSYNQGEKDRLYAIIADTKTKLAQAKTSDAIENKTTGIKTGLTKLVNQQPFTLDAKLKDYKDLIKESEEAYNNIAEYQKAVDNSTISQTYKNLANSSITKATNAVTKAVEEFKLADVRTAMSNLKTELSERVYGNVVKNAEKEIAKNAVVVAKADAVELLEEYTTCGYEDIEKTAKKSLEDIDKLTDAKAITRKATEDEGNLKKSLTSAETSKAAYETAVKNAMLTLNGTLDAMDEMKLSNEDVEAITRMIEVTKTSIENIEINSSDKVKAASTTVTKLTTEFNTFMSTYHKDINDDVKEYQFNTAKENALLTISEYTDSENKTIKSIATSAKQFVESVKFDAATADAKIKSINDKLSATTNDIEVEVAKEEAIDTVDAILEQLESYLDNSIYEVRSFANTAINTIKGNKSTINSKSGDGKNANTVITAIETEVGNAEKTRDTAIEKITDKINENATVIAKELEVAREKALKEIENYIELAQYIENESLETQLNEYWNSVNSTSELSEVNSIVSYTGSSLSSSCLLNKLINQVDAKLVVRADALKLVDDAYVALYTNADKTINETIKDDAVLKTEFDAVKETIRTDKTNITAQAMFEAAYGASDSATGTLRKKIYDWSTAVSTAVTHLEVNSTTFTKDSLTLLESSIRRISDRYIKSIKDITYAEYYNGSQKVGETVVDVREKDCLAEVKTELTAELTEYAKKQINAKIDAVADKATLDTTKTADAFVESNAFTTAIAFKATTVDGLITDALGMVDEKTASNGKLSAAIAAYSVVK